MGVRGLMSYIESKTDILKDLKFRSSKLIIDGCNLYYTLFFKNELEQMYGGDYDAFESLIKKFFNNLKDCDIYPYVVIDGGSDHTDKKFETVIQRDQDRVKKAYGLSMKGKGECPALLLKNVFMQTLDKLNVPYIQCIEEADLEIASLAKEWNCPVLSNDSDFYIFDITAGLLPFQHFMWKNVKKNKATSQKYISSKHFTVERLCSSFNQMNKDLLPVFACILGNDYVKLQNIISLRWEKHSEHSQHHMAFARIDGLLCWLSKFPGPEAAVDDVLKLIQDNKEKDSVREALHMGINDYKLINGSLAQFFQSNTLTTCSGPLQALPEWTLRRLNEGKMGSFLINILLLKRVIMTPQVEDFQRPSSTETSRPIRQVLYGLILLGKQQTAAAKASPFYVTEYIRQEIHEESDEKFSLSGSEVEAIGTVDKKRLQLETLCEEPHSLRLQIFLDTLGVSSSLTLQGIPLDLQLQVIVTHYWLVNAQPQPNKLHLWGLLLGMVYGKISSMPDTQTVGGLDKLLMLKRQGRILLDREAAHLYSQWQCCLWWSLNLNRLLCFPLPEPECARLYCGTLVHQTVKELKRGVKLGSLLVKGSDAERLFRQLRGAVHNLTNAGKC